MKIIRGNLPLSLYEAICKTNDKYSKGNADYSATQLIDSPRISMLRKQHWDEIEENASDMIWRFFGHIAHSCLENTSDWNVLKEERMYSEINSKVISGCPDLFDGNKITDYKVTSKYKVVNGIDISWENQLNVYRYILANNKWEPAELEIVAILRDARVDDEKVSVLGINLWNISKAENYIQDRVQAHIDAETVLPFCTEKERWYSDRKFAVMKAGNKKALKLFDLKIEASLYVKLIQEKEKKLIYIDERPGKSRRCEKYCNVNKFCSQYQQEQDLLNGQSN